jgi:hypothetical protein
MGYISTTNSRQSVNLFVEPDHLQFSGKGCHLPLLCIRRFVVKDGARLRIPPTRGVDNVARWRGGFLCSEASRVDAVDQVDHPRVGARGGGERREMCSITSTEYTCHALACFHANASVRALVVRTRGAPTLRPS